LTATLDVSAVDHDVEVSKITVDFCERGVGFVSVCCDEFCLYELHSFFDDGFVAGLVGISGVNGAVVMFGQALIAAVESGFFFGSFDDGSFAIVGDEDFWGATEE
jgi:hypothetical protein